MREHVYRHRRSGRRVRERRVTSVHEAAHAVVAGALGLRVERVMLESTHEGYTAHAVDTVADAIELLKMFPEVARVLRLAAKRRADVVRFACVAMAGPLAEERLLGRMTAGGRGDREDVDACADLLGLRGRRARARFFDEAEAKAKAILDERWPDVVRVARMLLRRERVSRWRPLSGRELRALVRQGLRL